MNQQNPPTIHNSHAIVIGGSVAGLLTARVLTDFFETVTVIERDHLPDQPAIRKGAPHAPHAHGLFVRGQQIMEEFFPGFTATLLNRGATPINMGSEAAIYMQSRRVIRFHSALTPIACSRSLIEYALYSKLRQHPRVRFRLGCVVEGINTDITRTRVTGVKLRRRDQPHSESEQLTAQLVVDASGRSSRLPQWLARMGHPAPNEITVNAKAG